jgi:hypothetical protein
MLKDWGWQGAAAKYERVLLQLAGARAPAAAAPAARELGGVGGQAAAAKRGE